MGVLYGMNPVTRKWSYLIEFFAVNKDGNADYSNKTGQIWMKPEDAKKLASDIFLMSRKVK